MTTSTCADGMEDVCRTRGGRYSPAARGAAFRAAGPQKIITRVRHADPDGPAARLEVPPPAPRHDVGKTTRRNSPSRHGANAQVKRQAKPPSPRRHVIRVTESSGLPLAGAGETGEASRINSIQATTFFVSSKATVNVIGPKAIPRDTEGSPQVNPVRIHPAQGNLPGSAENP